jgi:hypothetical protein
MEKQHPFDLSSDAITSTAEALDLFAEELPQMEHQDDSLTCVCLGTFTSLGSCVSTLSSY